MNKVEVLNSQDWSVAIPVFNAIHIVERSISFLVDSGVPAEKIVVLDDGSTDETWKNLRRWCEEIGATYNRFDSNVGYTKNINRIGEIESEFILLMNSDCLIRLSEIEGLIDIAKQFPFLAGVGPVSNDSGSQTVKFSNQKFWFHLDNSEIEQSIRYISPGLRQKFGARPFVVPSVNGFCTLWRRAAILEINGFDEINFERGYGEEDDFCYRLLEAGWFCAIAPWLLAIHFKTQSFTKEERSLRKPNALATLEKIHSRRFMEDIVTFFERHPVYRQLVIEAVD